MTSVVPLPTTVEMSSEVPNLLWDGFLYVGGVCNHPQLLLVGEVSHPHPLTTDH